MGIESRDYYRQPPGGDYTGGPTRHGLPRVCKYLIIANVVVFCLQIFSVRTPRPEDLGPHYGTELRQQLPPISVVQTWFQLKTDKVLQGQVWRVVTCAFCHNREDIFHVVFNMLFLFWFGKTLEVMYGSREFLLFYFLGAVISSVAYMGLEMVTGDRIPAIGASGAVMGVVMLYAIHFPRNTVLLFFVIPVPIWMVVVFYAVYDLRPVLLELTTEQSVQTGVAHAAHLGGLGFGFLYWKLGLRLERFTQGIPRPRFDRIFGSRRTIRVYGPSSEQQSGSFELKVDAVLRKIHDHGEASLTEKERDLLRAASRRYQNRQR